MKLIWELKVEIYVFKCVQNTFQQQSVTDMADFFWNFAIEYCKKDLKLSGAFEVSLHEGNQHIQTSGLEAVVDKVTTFWLYCKILYSFILLFSFPSLPSHLKKGDILTEVCEIIPFNDIFRPN
jgi:hypothetical protein